MKKYIVTALLLASCSSAPSTPALDGATTDLGGGRADVVTAATCETTAQCDGVPATRGYLCIAGACRTCESDGQCSPETRYGSGATCSASGRCERTTCPAGTVGCPCGASGVCAAGVCDMATMRCRALRTCAMAGCAEHQVCAAGAGGDAQCQEGCEPGYTWDATARRCSVLAGLNCRMGDAMSVLAMCETAGRRCVEEGGSARCGGCVDGRVLDGTQCRVARTCGEVGCSAQNRECRATTATADAECQGCLVGFVMGDGGACVMATGPVTCATLGCDGQHRACSMDAAGERCGACVTGYREGAGGACEVVPTCATLDCTTQHRACSMDASGARCGACDAGYVEEAGACRALRTCATVMCAAGQRCVEGSGPTDARCEASATCAEGQIRDRFTMTCVDCPLSCAGGIVRRGLTGRPHSDTVYVGDGMAGRCICETQPGYYLEEGATGGVFPCDADGDGWVQANARGVIEVPTTDMGRLPLRVNARCRVREMTAVELVNDAAQTYRDALAVPVSLYEARRNDDQGQLDLETGAVPRYGSGGADRALRAEEINSLTKACVSVSADHNGNFIEDVRESDTSTLRSGTGGDTIPAALLPAYQVYLRYGYFVELHRGGFTPADVSLDGTMPTSGPVRSGGVYRITERSRTATAADRVAPTYSSSADPYWRQCVRRRDGQYADDATVGMDLARYTAAEFGGMSHHSQFRCVQVVDGTTTIGATDRHLLRIADAVATTSPWTLNRCRLSVDPIAPAMTPNPYEARATCTTDGVTATVGQVYWGAAGYQDYSDPSRYARGCINECLQPALAPADHRCAMSVDGACLTRLASFGQPQCCPPGQIVCGGACIDIASSVVHCGACNAVCALPNVQSNVCLAGTCGVGTCAGAFRDCNSVASDGCESNSLTDNLNCGACGIRCPGDCRGGVCVGVLDIDVGYRDFWGAGGSTCAVLTDRTVRCWGLNNIGQVGDGTTIDRLVPTVVPGLSDVAEVNVGFGRACARLMNGTVACWGSGISGSAVVGGLASVSGISVSRSHGCARTASGSVSCWDGSLGSHAPVAGLGSVIGIADATSDTSASGPLVIYTCASLLGGNVSCWGSNGSGQLGDGTTTSRSTPAIVPGLTGVTQVAVGGSNACARVTDGSVRCWGRDFGLIPVVVPGLSNVVSVSLGDRYGSRAGCALSQDGTVRCWGSTAVPVEVSGLTRVVQVVTGGRDHTCVRRSDNSLWCWGGNSHGEIGDGTTTPRPEPVLVPGLYGR